MANGEEKIKKCPLLGEWCIKEACAMWAEMSQPMGGTLMKKMGTCAFNANLMLLSEINAKTRVPAQKVNIPPLLRG